VSSRDEGLRLPVHYDWRKAMRNNQFPAAGSIEDTGLVAIGGIDQWISVRGSSADNPLILWLHGGPGYPMAAETWTFQRPWEDFFTMVHWDQRGCGKTARANEGRVEAGTSAEPLTIARVQQDAEELIEYLLQRYGKRKLLLLGHSFGSIIGMRIARDRPELLHAYIGVGQIGAMMPNETASYRITLEKARADANAKAIAELEAIAPYPVRGYPLEDIFLERKWAAHYGGMITCLKEDDEIERWRMSPLYDDEDVEVTVRSSLQTLAQLFPEFQVEDLFTIKSLDCPLYLFMGAEDLATPAEVARALFDQVQAPAKRYFEYPATAHYPFMEAPGRFLLDLVTHVRPVASGTAAAI
jgi:proline iminopeptidase